MVVPHRLSLLYLNVQANSRNRLERLEAAGSYWIATQAGAYVAIATLTTTLVKYIRSSSSLSSPSLAYP